MSQRCRLESFVFPVQKDRPQAVSVSRKKKWCHKMASVLIADPESGAVHPDRRILNGKELDIFPLAPNEHTVPHHIFHTETSGPTDHEIIGPFLSSTLRNRRNWNGSSLHSKRIAKGICYGGIIAPHHGARHVAIDIHAPNRKTAEHIGQEVVVCPSRATPEGDHVLDLRCCRPSEG